MAQRDTDHDCCDGDYQCCCLMQLLLLTRAVESGFLLVAEDDGWGDDEECREQEGRCIGSEHQPPATQEYLHADGWWKLLCQ